MAEQLTINLIEPKGVPAMPNFKSLSLSLSALTLLAVLLLLPPVGGAGQEAAPAGARGYSAEVSIAPAAGVEGAYECRAKVQDLQSGEVVFGPRLSFMKGEPARSESTAAGSGEKFVFEVGVEAGVATYTLEVLRGAAVVSRHKASVALQAG